MYKLAETPVNNRAVMPSKIPVRIKEPPVIQRRESAPSKLEQLAADFRQKLYREKLKKLNHLYQNDSDRVLYETRGYGSAGNDGREGKHGLMREFFRERHALDEGYLNNKQYQANIKYHYQKKKNEFYRGHSPGKPPLPQNRSAGRDRSKPLAPINRPSPGRQAQNVEPVTGVMPSPKPPLTNKPQFVRNHHSASNSSGSQSPPQDLVKLPTEKALIPLGAKNPIPAISSHSNDEEDTDNNGAQTGSAVGHQSKLTQKNTGPRIRQPQANVKRSPQLEHKQQVKPPGISKQEKLTSYQKWQMEQDIARRERLRRYREQQQKESASNEVSGYESDVSSTPNPSSRQNDVSSRRPPSGRIYQKKAVILKKTKPPLSDEEDDKKYDDSDGEDVGDDDDDDDDDEQAELLRKQAELEALIEKQKHELEEMRKQRLLEEENERLAREKRKKEMESRREQAKKLQEKEARSESHLSRRSSYSNVHDGYESSVPSRQDQSSRGPATTPAVSSTPTAGRRKNSLPKRRHVEERREPTPNNENTEFYLQMAEMHDATVEVILKPCPKCGRKFAEDRLHKHINVCQNASKKRKVFDPMKMRVQGTEFEQYAKKAIKAKREKTPPRKTWRTQHENFIKAIRYAKKVTAIESAGGNKADLPPPPPTENPDYKQCPYCERRFDPNVADRHIPRCKNIKARPAPPKQRRR